LRRELRALDTLAVRARGVDPRSPEWEAWVAQLRRVFTSADDACREIAHLLAEPVAPAPARRWFGRRGKET
jgi:hypothetical protein